MELDPAYRVAFLDWLACASGGRNEPAAAAARAADGSLLGRVVALGAAGHVLDFDDTYAPGLAHCTAPVAPAVLVVGAELGRSIDDVLSAYGRGFEATAALARGSHPELYRRGWHPTAVCGVVGAAVGSAAILGLDDERTRAAVTLSLLQAAGLRSAFGSGGKPLQVGMAAASGARAALLAREGASAPAEVRAGFEVAYGATWAVPDPERPAIHENWIKAYPCCLQTHSAIEAADMARLRYSQKSGAKEELRVFVHAVSLQAAPYGVPADSLQAKFSIPYTTAFSFLHGPPTVGDFRSLDPEALELSGHIEVLPDLDVGESGATFDMQKWDPITASAALGSPARPMDEQALHAKVRALAGVSLEGALHPGTPASEVLGLLGHSGQARSQAAPNRSQ